MPACRGAAGLGVMHLGQRAAALASCQAQARHGRVEALGKQVEAREREVHAQEAKVRSLSGRCDRHAVAQAQCREMFSYILLAGLVQFATPQTAYCVSAGGALSKRSSWQHVRPGLLVRDAGKTEGCRRVVRAPTGTEHLCHSRVQAIA